MLPYIFTEYAMEDIVKQALYYEDRETGLGKRFMDELRACAEEVSRMPVAFVSHYKATRERKLKRFPYKLIYSIEEVIFIHAVYPSKANPKNKYKRVRK